MENLFVAGNVVYAEIWTGESQWDGELLEPVSDGAKVIGLDRGSGNKLWSRATTSLSYGEEVPADNTFVIEAPSDGLIALGRLDGNETNRQSEQTPSEVVHPFSTDIDWNGIVVQLGGDWSARGPSNLHCQETE